MCIISYYKNLIGYNMKLLMWVSYNLKLSHGPTKFLKKQLEVKITQKDNGMHVLLLVRNMTLYQVMIVVIFK